VRFGDRLVNGRGLSTDVVEAGIRALLDAINVYLGSSLPQPSSGRT